MKKETYAFLAFEQGLRSLVGLAQAADVNGAAIYGLLRAWVLAYEEYSENHGVPSSAIAEMQTHSWKLARQLVADLEKMGEPIRGKFPDEVPDPPREADP